MDNRRLEFAQFWHPLAIEKLKALSDACANRWQKAWFLTTLGDRTADRDRRISYYSDAIEVLKRGPESNAHTALSRRQELVLLCEIGLRLHRHAALDPHLGAFERVIRDYEKSLEALNRWRLAPQVLPPQPRNLPTLTALPDSPELVLCQILLDREASLEQAIALIKGQSPSAGSPLVKSTSASRRFEQSQFIAHWTRLYPEKMFQSGLVRHAVR